MRCAPPADVLQKVSRRDRQVGERIAGDIDCRIKRGNSVRAPYERTKEDQALRPGKRRRGDDHSWTIEAS